MDDMGYQNADRVEALCREGKLSVANEKGVQTLNLPAYAIMMHLALRTRSKEAAKAGEPYWCYWDGWDEVISQLGMVLPPAGREDALLDGDFDIDKFTGARIRSCRNQMGRISSLLVEMGVMKQLRPANKFGHKNALWLLLLGESPEENAEAERVARRAFGLPEA